MADLSNQSNAVGNAVINVGDKVDKYEIIAQIGAGGTSIVWKGYDKLLDRTVAIKQLSPELQQSDEGLSERFRREAAVQKRITMDQAHLVQIFDFIEDDRGLFIIMEYVDGVSLETMLQDDSHAMDAKKALGIVGATAMALNLIHEQGIIHRDLKPSNILMPSDGGLKICDFGLAAVIDDQDALSTGTVRYMAPELSRSEDGSPRSDIYSLGMIAYELLAGRAAFEQAFKIVLRDQRNQALRWMKWHTNERAKATPLSKLNPQVPQTLSDLVARMMEKDPAQRVTDGHDLLAAIRRHFAEQQAAPAPQSSTAKATVLEQVPTSPAEPTATLPTTSKVPYILIGILALQVLLGGGFMLMSQGGEKAAQQEKLNEARETFNIAKSDYDAGRYGSAAERFRRLADTWPHDKVLGRGSTAFALLCQGRLDLEAGRYDASLKSFEEAEAMGVLGQRHQEDIRRLIREVQSARAFETELAKIRKQMQDGRYDLARQSILDQRRLSLTDSETKMLNAVAAQLEDQARQQKIDRIVQSANREADAGDLDKAINILKDAQRDYSSRKIDSLLESLKKNVSYAEAIRFADRAAANGDLAGAILQLRKAQKIRREDAVETRIKRYQSTISFNKARQAERSGDTEAAARLYTESLGHFENKASRDALARMEKADQKASFVRAGDAARVSRNYDAAVQQYQNALKFGPDPEIRAKLVTSRVRQQAAKGIQLLGQGKLDEARKALNAARNQSPDDPEVLAGLAELNKRAKYQQLLEEGDMLRDESDFGEAKRAYLQARDVIRTPEVQQRIDDTEYDHLLAQARNYMRSAAWSSARALLRSAGRIKVTDELKSMLKEVAEHLPRDLNE